MTKQILIYGAWFFMERKDFKICCVGLGYVGLPLALALSKHFEVYGFDVDEKRIETLKEGIDVNGESLGQDIKECAVEFSSDEAVISKANFIIVGVPTPITKIKKPDLSFLKRASKMIGQNLSKGSVVVFESTVYPGATEEYCAPIIEKESGFKCGVDWKIGYSPERINPGDLEHTIDKVVKVVSGMDDETLKKISFVYSQITKVHEASSIKVAEAAKAIENAQRDLNIAFVNELSIIFKKMNIDTLEVLEAAGTKWNFLNFKPGLVGGHCIGVDPYYLTYKSEELGYIPEVILAGRRINDSMHKEIIRILTEELNKNKKPINGSNILILGATFKENVKDARNSKVENIIQDLKKLGANIQINDPLYKDEITFDHATIKNTNLNDINKNKQLDAVIYAVPHKEYELNTSQIESWMKQPIIIDIKGKLQKTQNVFRL